MATVRRGDKKNDGAKAILLPPRHDRLSTLQAYPRGGKAHAPSAQGTQQCRYGRKLGVNHFQLVQDKSMRHA